MKVSHLRAIEKQAEWLHWLKSPHLFPAELAEGDYLKVMGNCGDILTHAETLYMNANFCSLIDHARLILPDDSPFEASWVPCPWGFLYLETPFTVPPQPAVPYEVRIRAIGWRPSEVIPGATLFVVFIDGIPGTISAGGFSSWSHFTLREGMPLLETTRRFETDSITVHEPGYGSGKQVDELHEIRWVYTALSLMSQPLSVTVPEPVSPLARSMARRKGRKLNSLLKVVTLRRMEYDRQQEQGQHSDREYHWQWVVRGHWRRQPYGHGATYRNIFIDSYVKGPQNMPLKPLVRTLFVAAR